VLRGVLPRHQHPKLALRWVGPYKIIQVLTDFIFILQHLVTGDKCEVHGSRVLYFRNSAMTSRRKLSSISNTRLGSYSRYQNL
jgi:hypothetical protein